MDISLRLAHPLMPFVTEVENSSLHCIAFADHFILGIMATHEDQSQ